MIKEHLLPNCIGQLIATVMLQIPSAIFTEAFLSYLGIGVSAPMASLGSLTSEALNGITTYPLPGYFPGGSHQSHHPVLQPLRRRTERCTGSENEKIG